MTSTEAFAARYSKMTREELERIAADEENLLPEALQALRAELNRRPPEEQVSEISSDPLFGVRGWLAFYCFGAIVGSLAQISKIPAIDLHSPLSICFTFFGYFVVAFGVITGVSVAMEAGSALRFVLIYFILQATILGLLTLEGILTFTWNPQLAKQGGELIGTGIVGAIPWVIWFWYFKVSKRVRATFGRNL